MKDAIQEEYGNNGILAITVKLIDKEMRRIITAYRENNDAKKKEKDKFFKQLQRQIDKGEKQTIIMGDLNGRVRNRNNRLEQCMGRGEDNNKEERIIEV